jgi:PAS domain S-box-containing protein
VPVARKAVIDGLSDGMIALDVRDRVVDLNPAAQRIAGITPDGIGRPVTQVLAGWPSLLEHVRRSPDGRAELVQDPALDGGGRWFEVRISGLYERPQRRSGRLIVLHDITDRKQAERALAVARDEALEATELKSQLLTKVGHEFKTPLGAVLGYAELMQRGTFGVISERQRQVVERMIHSTRYLNKLVNELLDQSQLEAGKVRLTASPFSPREMIDQVCAQMIVLAEARGLALVPDVDPDVPPMLVGDQSRLQQILINLIGNALKFTPQGRICVRLYVASPERWAMQVADTGPGISAETQRHIFEPFWQMDNSLTGDEKGYGLGLSIVKQLTALMGGEILLDSDIGRGSTFTILLPLVLESIPVGELVLQ